MTSLFSANTAYGGLARISCFRRFRDIFCYRPYIRAVTRRSPFSRSMGAAMLLPLRRHRTCSRRQRHCRPAPRQHGHAVGRRSLATESRQGPSRHAQQHAKERSRRQSPVDREEGGGVGADAAARERDTFLSRPPISHTTPAHAARTMVRVSPHAGPDAERQIFARACRRRAMHDDRA